MREYVEPLFDERQAIFLAAVCSQTYTQFTDPQGKFVVPERYAVAAEFDARSFTGQRERFGFILESEDRIIVAFRGTSTTSDWVSDAIARQRKFKYAPDAGETHVGMTDIYDSARGQVIGALGKLPPDKRLTVTGHSLGGALAALCAADAAANTKFGPPTAYTYGAPRVGDPVFARAYSRLVGDSRRVANVFDAVPLLPPRVYKLPKQETTFYYMHVREDTPLRFNNGSVSANHVIGSYYEELAKLDPAYAKLLRAGNPGFCPVPELRV